MELFTGLIVLLFMILIYYIGKEIKVNRQVFIVKLWEIISIVIL